jgi:multiple sugar transport system ATP-binding protein
VPAQPRLLLGLRPERISVHPASNGLIPAEVAVVERLGAETVVGCRLMGGTTRFLEHQLVFARLPGRPAIAVNDPCALDYAPSDVVWFDPDTEQRIGTSP